MTPETVDEPLSGVSGILVPGGFGSRGIDGKLLAIQYAREHKVPFLGLCLGMQLAIVEFARHAAGLAGAHSAELDPDTPYPVIHLMPEQNGVENLGGTLRLGSYPCVLAPGSKAAALYGAGTIHGAAPSPLRGQQRLPGGAAGARPGLLRPVPRRTDRGDAGAA